MNYLISCILILLSALFSGMNLGLMSLDPYELKRKIALGDSHAKKIYAVRKRGNLLLVTLLLGNVAVISALSLYLESIVSGVVAGLATTILITIFGEIIPQALFSRYAMSLGVRLVWLVRFFIIVFYPICAPLAWLLDKLLGDELPTIYSKRELAKIIEEHKHSSQSELDTDEERIIRGALTFAEKSAKDVMTPRSMVVSVNSDQVVDKKMVDRLRASGHSRFPVIDQSAAKVIGTVYLRDLLRLPKASQKVTEICDKKVYYINKDDSLDDVLNAFLKTRHHLFVVVNEFAETEGVLSLEDVLEVVIRRQIVDEFDEHEDLRAVAKKQSRQLKIGKPGLSQGTSKSN